MNNFKPGTYTSDQRYIPSPIARQWEIPPVLTERMALIQRDLRRLDYRAVPDPEGYLKMRQYSEAVASSAIEGIHTHLTEALGEAPRRQKRDWEEVQRYVAALRWARGAIDRPLIKGLHAHLMTDSRAQPGLFRRVAVRVGRYLPPPPSKVPELMEDLELFYFLRHPPLLKAGIGHVQFETIHPFVDGNGRVGRMLIILGLVEAGFLKLPIFSISPYIYKRRQAYYEALDGVRHGRLNEWMDFFLTAMEVSIAEERVILARLQSLQNELEARSLDARKKENVGKLLRYLWKEPVVSMQEAAGAIGKSRTAARGALEALGDQMEKVGTQYRFRAYIDIFS